MKKIVSILLILLGFGKAQAQKLENSLLWSIEGKELKQPSYLLGSVHIICPSDYFWTPAMDSAYKSAEQVVFEADLSDPSMQMKQVQAVMLPENTSLASFYSPEDYEKIKTALSDIKMLPEAVYSRMKPLALSAVLITQFLTCSMPEGYETNVLKMAKKDGKPVLGLESLEFQFNLLYNTNIDSSAKYLLEMITDKEKGKDQIQRLFDAYKKQDIEKLYQIIVESPEFKRLENEFLGERNKRWVPLIEQWTKEKPTFIVVGSGHLAGKDGVIQLLRNAGYKVKPVY